MSEPNWIRARFYSPEDSRPAKWPPPGPFWETGSTLDEPPHYTVVAYIRPDTVLQDYWPGFYDLDTTEEEEIKFSERFPEPDWWKVPRLESRAEQAEAKLAKAVETLEFYASEEPWSRNAIEGNHGDWGKRARKTLADLKGESGGG